MENVDINEIHQFEQYAEAWWDKEGPLRTLHDINPIRLAFIQKYSNLQNLKILDIGCGGGILTESLFNAGGMVTGIDMAEKVIEVAREHAAEKAIHYALCRAEEFSLDHPQQFDIITCMELLEHVPDPKKIIKAAADMTKPGGFVFFSTLNRTPTAYIKAIVGAEYLLKILPVNTHQYRQFIRPSELSTWASAYGLSTTAIKGMSYSPFTHKADLVDDVSVNYLMCLQK